MIVSMAVNVLFKILLQSHKKKRRPSSAPHARLQTLVAHLASNDAGRQTKAAAGAATAEVGEEVEEAELAAEFEVLVSLHAFHIIATQAGLPAGAVRGEKEPWLALLSTLGHVNKVSM
ncbi:hypothetical protein AVEN_261706-1 [Araneus ventricosus]|uniref:Uncharacterized protein n=1 Tax=Araneus ventricosus TaxID=182803 RepID=A0A4Y2DY97_ARAVE|nr:hypothetical protein AVEN_261706-1 [Araneus ventricosus]